MINLNITLEACKCFVHKILYIGASFDSSVENLKKNVFISMVCDFAQNYQSHGLYVLVIKLIS